MPGKYNYELMHKYPHLLGEDILIWNRFIEEYPSFFDTVDYDVKVGTGVNSEVISDKKYRTYYEDLTKKRIDVIGWTEAFITIVEIKKRVSLGTLGQILGYKFLFSLENPEHDIIKTLIITSSLDIDDQKVIEHFSIPYMVVK